MSDIVSYIHEKRKKNYHRGNSKAYGRDLEKIKWEKTYQRDEHRRSGTSSCVHCTYILCNMYSSTPSHRQSWKLNNIFYSMIIYGPHDPIYSRWPWSIIFISRKNNYNDKKTRDEWWDRNDVYLYKKNKIILSSTYVLYV